MIEFIGYTFLTIAVAGIIYLFAKILSSALKVMTGNDD